MNSQSFIAATTVYSQWRNQNAHATILTKVQIVLLLSFLFRRQKSRPMSNPYCQAGLIPFCPTGRSPNTMPTFKPTDTLYVYAMKAPVWEFKFGDLLGKFVSGFSIYKPACSLLLQIRSPNYAHIDLTARHSVKLHLPT